MTVKREVNGRDSKGRFMPGNKGGGRKAVPKDVKEMLKEASPGAVQLLIETMKDKNAKIDIRIRCAETILDRAYGKPTQPIDGDLAGGIDLNVVIDYGDTTESK